MRSLSSSSPIYVTSILLAVLFSVSCRESVELPPAPPGVQTWSLLGDTLRTPEITPELHQEHNSRFIEAVTDYRVNPEDPEVLIRLGRQTAFLGEYREAVRIFTESIYKHPEDPRMYGHRGHNYLILRRFEPAIRDLENAESLIQHGFPSLPDTPGSASTLLASNIRYHLGLAYYLKGDFRQAADVYDGLLSLPGLTDEMNIASRYWAYMTLKRMGLDMEAGRLIADFPAETYTNLDENDVYLNLLMVFKGVFDPDRLMESSDNALQDPALGYGIGNWHYMNGRTERAYEIWQTVYDSAPWPAIGTIAAEAELARRYRKH